MSDRFSTDLESYLTNHGFECLESIGRGPKAEVFRCHHLESGTDMALKIWALSRVCRRITFSSFLSESQIAYQR